MGDEAETPLEERSRTLFEDSVESVDMRVRSRLNRARHAALEAAAVRPGARLFGLPLWTPAAGVAAAVLIGTALWLAPQMGYMGNHGAPAVDGQAYEDLDIVAATDEMELLQDDPEFYDWAEKIAGPDSGSVG